MDIIESLWFGEGVDGMQGGTRTTDVCLARGA